MKTISQEEFLERIQNYDKRKVEICFESKNAPTQISTYQEFYCGEGFDHTEEKDIIIFQDGKEAEQRIYIGQKDIKQITYLDGNTIYDTVFSVELENGKVDICISEEPMICRRCGKILDNPIDTIWTLHTNPNFGSFCDGDNEVNIEFCDNCACKILYNKDGERHE